MITKTIRPDERGTHAYTIDPDTVTESELEALPYHYLCALSDIIAYVYPHKTQALWRGKIGAVSLI